MNKAVAYFIAGACLFSISAFSSEGLVTEPNGCYKSKIFPCAIQADAKKTKLEIGKTKVILSARSTIVVNGESDVQLLKGNVWIHSESNSDFRLKTEFGNISSNQDFNGFFRKNHQHVEIYPLSGFLQISPLGLQSDKSIQLLSGYRSQLGSVTEKGVAHYEFPIAANLKGLIQDWAPLFDGSPQELTKFLSNYKQDWELAVEQSSNWHKEIAQREIASAEKERLRQEKLRQRRLQEARELRALFRKKNYLE